MANIVIKDSESLLDEAYDMLPQLALQFNKYRQDSIANKLAQEKFDLMKSSTEIQNKAAQFNYEQGVRSDKMKDILATTTSTGYSNELLGADFNTAEGRDSLKTAFKSGLGGDFESYVQLANDIGAPASWTAFSKAKESSDQLYTRMEVQKHNQIYNYIKNSKNWTDKKVNAYMRDNYGGDEVHAKLEAAWGHLPPETPGRPVLNYAPTYKKEKGGWFSEGDTDSGSWFWGPSVAEGELDLPSVPGAITTGLGGTALWQLIRAMSKGGGKPGMFAKMATGIGNAWKNWRNPVVGGTQNPSGVWNMGPWRGGATTAGPEVPRLGMPPGIDISKINQPGFWSRLGSGSLKLVAGGAPIAAYMSGGWLGEKILGPNEGSGLNLLDETTANLTGRTLGTTAIVRQTLPWMKRTIGNPANIAPFMRWAATKLPKSVAKKTALGWGAALGEPTPFGEGAMALATAGLSLWEIGSLLNEWGRMTQGQKDKY